MWVTCWICNMGLAAFFQKSWRWREARCDIPKKLLSKYCSCIELLWIFHFAKNLQQLVFEIQMLVEVVKFHPFNVYVGQRWHMTSYSTMVEQYLMLPKSYLYAQSNMVSLKIESYVLDIYIQIWSDARKKYNVKSRI